MQSSIKFHSYLGFGDQMYMRRFVLDAKQKFKDVYVVTPFPDLLYQGTDIKCLAPRTRLKTQKEWTDKTQQRSGSLFSADLPRYDRVIRFQYGPNFMSKRQSILTSFNEQFRICNDAHLGSLDYSFPVKPEWKDKARSVMGEIPKGKKLCVLKLPTQRTEWLNKSRNPLMKYFQRAIDMLKDKYYFVSVADTRNNQEWLSEPCPVGIDVIKHKAEFELDALMGLCFMADLIVTCPSHMIPLCLFNKYPCFVIYGGHAPDYVHIDPVPRPETYGFIEPDNMCFCVENDHNCNKEINMFRFDEALKKHVNKLYKDQIEVYSEKGLLLISRLGDKRCRRIAHTVKETFNVATIDHHPVENYKDGDFIASYQYDSLLYDPSYAQVRDIIRRLGVTHALIAQKGNVHAQATEDACRDENVNIMFTEAFFDDKLICDCNGLQYCPDNDLMRFVEDYKGDHHIEKPSSTREYQPEIVPADQVYSKYNVDPDKTIVFLAQLCYDEAVKQPFGHNIDSYYHFIESLIRWNAKAQILIKYHPQEADIDEDKYRHRRFENEFENVTVCDESIQTLFNSFEYFCSFSSTTIFEGVIQGKRFATGGYHLCGDDRLVIQIRSPENFTRLIYKFNVRLKMDKEYLIKRLAFITQKYAVSMDKPDLLNKLIQRENFYIQGA